MPMSWLVAALARRLPLKLLEGSLPVLVTLVLGEGLLGSVRELHLLAFLGDDRVRLMRHLLHLLQDVTVTNIRGILATFTVGGDQP